MHLKFASGMVGVMYLAISDISSSLLKFTSYTIMIINAFPGDLPSYSPNLIQYTCLTVERSPGSPAALHVPGAQTGADCTEINKAQN